MSKANMVSLTMVQENGRVTTRGMQLNLCLFPMSQQTKNSSRALIQYLKPYCCLGDIESLDSYYLAVIALIN